VIKRNAVEGKGSKVFAHVPSPSDTRFTRCNLSLFIIASLIAASTLASAPILLLQGNMTKLAELIELNNAGVAHLLAAEFSLATDKFRQAIDILSPAIDQGLQENDPPQRRVSRANRGNRGRNRTRSRRANNGSSNGSAATVAAEGGAADAAADGAEEVANNSNANNSNGGSGGGNVSNGGDANNDERESSNGEDQVDAAYTLLQREAEVLLYCQPFIGPLNAIDSSAGSWNMPRMSGCYLYNRPFTLNVATASTDRASFVITFSSRDLAKLGAAFVFNHALTNHSQDAITDQSLTMYNIVSLLNNNVDLLSLAALNNSALWFIENAETDLAQDHLQILHELTQSDTTLAQHLDRDGLHVNLSFMISSSSPLSMR
jgi:hypothetical protein